MRNDSRYRGFYDSAKCLRMATFGRPGVAAIERFPSGIFVRCIHLKGRQAALGFAIILLIALHLALQAEAGY